ncbi:MAG: MsnO8 family LLM class oxidoreductase [Paracoccus aminovorans]|nr:MsnO8 family LLM class oxidoreductase [Paracoccus aminovorans]
MTYRLSLLDKSPVAAESSGAEALALTLDYARLADALGYHRFWLAEHHALPGLASAAPEILIAQVAALTRRIRVGSGGVLIQHYAPFKVAELFSVLAALAPGRIDLGVGKSPGGLPLATRALQAGQLPDDGGQIDRKLAELEAWLAGGRDGLAIQPRPALRPQTFLLGGSPASAAQAARLGWNFVHAGHQDGDRANTLASLGRFQTLAGHRPILAVQAFAAPTRAEAEDRVAGLKMVRLQFADGHAVNLGSVEAAEDYARQYGSADFTLTEKRPTVIAGTGEDIHAELHALHLDLGVPEFIIDQPVAERALRLRSIELIAAVAARAAA